MGYKMKGSPAKLGTIQGTTGHTSALKMASSPAPFIGKVVGAIGKAAGVVSKITGGAGKIGEMANKVSKGAETAGKLVKKGKTYLSKAKAKRASRVKKYDVGGEGKADGGKKKAIFPEDRVAGSPAKHRMTQTRTKKGNPKNKYSGGSTTVDLKHTHPKNEKKGDNISIDGQNSYISSDGKKSPAKSGTTERDARDAATAKATANAMSKGMGGMKGKKSPAKIGGLGGLILKGAMKKVGKKVGKVTELAKSMPAPEASPAKLHKKGHTKRKITKPKYPTVRGLKLEKKIPISTKKPLKKIKTPSKWIGTAIKIAGKGLAGRAAGLDKRDAAIGAGVDKAMSRPIPKI